LGKYPAHIAKVLTSIQQFARKAYVHPRRERIQAELIRVLPPFLLLFGFLILGGAIGNLADAAPQGTDSLFAENLQSAGRPDLVVGNGALLAFAVSSTFVITVAASYIFRSNVVVALSIVGLGTALSAALLLPGQPLFKLLPSGGDSATPIGLPAGLTPLVLGIAFAWCLSLLMLALIRDRNPWATGLYIALWIGALALFLPVFSDIFGQTGTAEGKRASELPILLGRLGIQVIRRRRCKMALRSPLLKTAGL
jgi:hypothetical protein